MKQWYLMSSTEVSTTLKTSALHPVVMTHDHPITVGYCTSADNAFLRTVSACSSCSQLKMMVLMTTHLAEHLQTLMVVIYSCRGAAV